MLKLVNRRLQAHGLAQPGNGEAVHQMLKRLMEFPLATDRTDFTLSKIIPSRPAQRAGVPLPGPGCIARPSAGTAWAAGMVIRRAGAAWPAGVRPDPGVPERLYRPGLPVRGPLLPGGLEIQLARATGWRITRRRPSGRRCCGNTISSDTTSTPWPCTNTWPCASRAMITNGISAGGFICSCAASTPLIPSLAPIEIGQRAAPSSNSRPCWGANEREST